MNITTRDLRVLEYLYGQGVATFGQLKDRFFLSEASARVRIHRLMREEYVCARRVEELKSISIASYRSAIRLLDYSMFGSRESVRKSKIYSLGRKIRTAHKKVESLDDPIMWKHQMILGEIRRMLESILPDSSLILNDPEVREKSLQFRIQDVIPDLCIVLKEKIIAIELERNSKSDLEYSSRIMRYASSNYTHVIYYCESERIFDLILNQAVSCFKVGVSMCLTPKKIFQKSCGFQMIRDFIGIS